jgi:translation initiation factor 2A
VQVVHPGSGCVAGRDAVLESWRLIFQGARGGLDIDLADVRVHAPPGGVAVVTCVERLNAGDTQGRVLATNVYEVQGGRYRMILHHGSPAPPPRGGGGGI